MRVLIEKNYEELSMWVATYIMQKINMCKKDKFILGLPTGSTPLLTYKYLIDFYKKKKVSFKNVVTFNMDEYVNLEPEHNQSYSYFMYNNFFNYIDIKKENINLLNGMAKDLNLECREYEDKIKMLGGIDLFLCGIGSDGHIAFNEPGSSFNSVTRIKNLCEETINDNSRFFGDLIENVPKQALTVGLKTVSDAKEIIIMANGLKKANAIRECIEGSISNQYTCTLAQMHRKAIVIIDEKATNELKVKTYNYYKNLQKNIDLFGNPLKNKLKEYILQNDKIMITSPHPDDDIIGCGGIMQLLPNKSNVKICYMTNGAGGIKNNNNYDNNTRINEAISSIKVLGYNKNQIINAKLPFYYTENRLCSAKDINCMNLILEKEEPNHLFICYDSDPNKTHDRCYNILKKCKYPKSVKYIWLYKSAWGKWNNDSNIEIILNENNIQNKLLAMDMHLSQEIPVVTNEKIKSFKNVIVDNSKFNLYPGKFIEKFKILSINDYIEK